MNLAYAVNVSTYGIYIGGNTGSDVATSVKHNLGADSMSTGGSLGAAKNGMDSTSNATTGYTAHGGSYSTVVEKYTFSTDGVASGTSLSYGMVNSSGCGNASYMVTGAGNRGGSGGEYVVARVEKYTYSGDTKADGTSLNQTADGRTATSSTTLGIWLGGNPNPSNGSKYTFSSDAVATVSNYVGTNRYRATPAASSTKGYYMSGTDGTVRTDVDVWTFSADTRVAGTAMGTAVDGGAGACNSTFAVKAGGSTGSYTTVVEKYVFSNDTKSNMTALSTAKGYAAGLSTAGNNF